VSRRTVPTGPLLVVAAWAPELTGFRRRMARANKDAPRRLAIHLTTVGVGLVEAGIGTTSAIDRYRPRRVVLVGTAGVFPGARGAHPVGSVAVADTLVLASQAVADQTAYLPAILPARLATHRGMSRALARAGELASASVLCPVGITRAGSLTRRRERSFGAGLENLEAFAVGRAAARARVPFTALLGVANVVGPAGHAEWKRAGPAAARRAGEALAAWLLSEADG